MSPPLPMRLFLCSLLLACPGVISADDPSPSAAGGSLTLGAYYYPWYSAAEPGERGWMSKALRGRLDPPQWPAAGVYSSRDPGVIGTHIAQSRRAGLDFWAVSWWGPGGREDRALREHILPHPDAGHLRYAILYESTGRLGRMDAPHYRHLLDDFAYLEEHYFDHPRYLRIDDRPVVFIYLTRVYFRDRGLDRLADLRRRFPRLYLVGDDVFGPRYEARHARLWDAITAYDVYGQSMQRNGATRRAVERLRGHYANAAGIAAAEGRAFIPAVAPGYNDTAVREGHPGRPRYFTDEPGSREGDVFRALLRGVAHPLADDRADRTVMITSFNEWYEDTQIEPTAGDRPASRRDDSADGRGYTGGDRYEDYGNLYLDILREEKAGSGGEKTSGEGGR